MADSSSESLQAEPGRIQTNRFKSWQRGDLLVILVDKCLAVISRVTVSLGVGAFHEKGRIGYGPLQSGRPQTPEHFAGDAPHQTSHISDTLGPIWLGRPRGRPRR